VPGILLTIGFCGWIVLRCLISPRLGPAGPAYAWGDRIQSLVRLLPTLLIFAVILGGIYGGIFTPTEAAVVAVFYGLLIGLVVYRNLNLQVLYEVLRDSSISTAVVMIVVAFAGLFSWTGSTLGVMDRAAQGLLKLSENPCMILLLLNGLLLIAGMLLDAISIYYVFLPILLPVIRHFGWDPMWFGVMMTVNMAIGTVTPPVALNLYVAANLADLSMERISRAAIPFVIALIAALLVITFIPSLSLWLPDLLGLR
jgi:C4-dicarboxylate transporter DctM subunit